MEKESQYNKNMTIAEKFYKDGAKPKPIAYDVGELKKLLSELPDDLPIELSFGEGVELVVYNHGHPSMHLSFVENN